MADSTRPILRGKPATRRTLLSRRDGLTEAERAERSVQIAVRMEEVLGRVAAGEVVALYAAKGSEVATAEIDRSARARGLVVAYPRITEERVLAFGIASRDELVPGPFGLREPAMGLREVSVDAIAMFVVPGIAFDRDGGRVGWGKGYYDATLARAARGAVRVGLAFECQVVEHVPGENHDQRLDLIVTEAATYAVARA